MDSKNCQNFSLANNLSTDVSLFTEDWILEEIQPDSVSAFFYRISEEYIQGQIDAGIPPTRFTGDDRKWQERIKDQANEESEKFLSHFEEGDKIWTYNNFSTNPGIVGSEYGLVIIEKCHLKWIEPIIVS
ncbi:MAG: hypothetical protein WC964_04280 [Acholeplasmataceae bacterium]